MTERKEEARKAFFSQKAGRGLFGSAFFAFFVVLLLGMGILFITAAVLHAYPGAGKHISLLGIVLSGLLALLGGAIAGGRRRHSGALTGVLFGTFYVLFLLLFSSFLGGAFLVWRRILGYSVLILLSLLGGVISTERPRARHHRRRHK